MALPGIEPGSRASETPILSIVLQGQAAKITVGPYCCFISLNKRSTSSFLHNAVPAFMVAAVPAATP